MRLVLVGLAASGLFGCGAKTHLETRTGDGAIRSDADAVADDPPSIVGSDATPPSVACLSCQVNGDCENGAACVANDGGPGYCAPGCNKEGYCTPDRMCERVLDPSGGMWSACLPLGGCGRVP